MEKQIKNDENGLPSKKKKKEVKNKDTIIAIDPQQKVKGDKLGEDARAIARSGRPSGTKATLVFAFGRMNPPTIGHEKLVNKVDEIGRRNRASSKVFLTHSQDKKKNPLTQAQKLRYAKSAFGPDIEAAPAKTLIDVLKELQKTYSDIIMVAGSDRVRDFKTLLNKYNMKEYHFDSIKVVSAGQRDPDAEGTTGMSASKMRQAAIDNKFSEFKKGLPSQLRTGKQMFNAVRKGLGVKEEVEESLWANIHKKRKEGRPMRKKGEKGAPTADQIKRAQGEEVSEKLIDERMFGKTGPFGGKSQGSVIIPALDRAIDRVINKKEYKDAVRAYLNFRRKNKSDPSKMGKSKENIAYDFFRNYGVQSPRQMIKYIDGLVKKGKLPKQLAIAEGIVVNEEEQVDEILTIAGRRKKAIAMRRQRLKIKRARERMKYRFAGAAQLKRRTRKKAVSAIKKRVAGSRGANYTKLSPGQKASVDRLVAKRKVIINKIAQRLAPKVRRAEAERLKSVRRKANEAFEAILNEVKSEDMIVPRTPQDKDIAKRRGTQPAKYHKGLAPSTKAKRDAQFKRQAKMRDDDPKAYKPAPGDATAKTKPSKYTKMYHDTYGEGVEMEYYELFQFIDKIQEQVSPALKARQDREKKQLAIRHQRQVNRAKIRNIRSEDINAAFNEIISEKSQSALAKKSEKSGISVGTLRKVYNRGVAAWKTGHRPGTTPQQWGYARVNAFIAKKKKGTLNHDKDLA